ncbi:MAG: hypothetical protein ACE5ID_02155, partial [Acidobacteriota bacterium]
VRRKAWLLRGRMEQLKKRGRTGRLGHLEMLPAGKTSLMGEDDEIPEIGEAFFYVAAQPDPVGQPLLGFGSDCRVRVLTP